MNIPTKRVVTIYLLLTLFSTLAASFIWGINTLFLLDAGLSITAAFAANAFFTIGQVIFEVPTGVIADTFGRRTSYLLGSATLLVSTLLYLYLWHIHAPFWGWALSSAFLGLGFTFFSGATEAWLVDSLHFAEYTGPLEAIFAKGQTMGGVAMLSGTVAGGLIAQATNLGVPYIVRAVFLGITFILAFMFMVDSGFTPRPREKMGKEMKAILATSVKYGLGNRPIRWLMLASPFLAGVSFYAFYAMQPYLLALYGNTQAYTIAGLAAAIVAGAQVVGGLIVPFVSKLFARRTTFLITSIIFSTGALALLGVVHTFWIAILLLVLWAISFATMMPVRQAYINGLIPSAQRATVLSTDNLISSLGGVVVQPGLGKAADVWSYATSYCIGAVIQLIALPFTLLAKSENAETDVIKK
jgi:MFS family permease